MICGSTRAHLVRFYEADHDLVEFVARFVGAGLGAGEGAILIATPPHRSGVEAALATHGLDLDRMRSAGRYLALDPAEALSQIMKGGGPDPEAFASVIRGPIQRAGAGSARPVRIFGEMVGLLWKDGEAEAAIRLEELWNELAAELRFALLCAYPVECIASGSRAFLRICGEHAQVEFPESHAPSSPADRQRMVARLERPASARPVGEGAFEPEAEVASRLAAILESSDEAIIGNTLDGVVTSWNPAAERIFGFRAEEMIGEPISRIVPADRQADLPRILEAVLRGERIEHYETERLRKNGQRVLVSLTDSPIEDANGRIVGISKIARDVTDRRLLDVQREELVGIAQRARAEAETEIRAKEEFLATLGHELRNPLAATRNALESAQLEPDTRDRALAIARRQARQLGRLVDHLLDVAQTAQGHVRLNRETISVSDLVEQAVETTRFLRESGGHTLSISLPGEEIRLECDPLRLEQVLVNLLSNAAKYTPRGGHIELRAEREDGHVVIGVRDDGVGIAPEVLARIFDPFVQAPQGSERASGGLGVGLTVAKSFVALHGGTIEARSDGLGKGAEFVVRLPAARVATPLARASQSSSDVAIPIVVIEDNRDVAESMAMLLEAFGHRVRVALDGASGLEASYAETPALMLVDIGLPGMDGYEVARRIRATAELRETVLVALTGYGQEEDRRRSREAGFDHHFTKPVDPSVLRSLIARIVASRPGRQRPL